MHESPPHSYDSRLAHLLKAGGYLALFVLSQTAVTTVFLVIRTLYAYLSGDIDPVALREELIGQTPLISLCSAVLTLTVVALVFLLRKKHLLRAVGLTRAPRSTVGAAASIAPALYCAALLVVSWLPKSWLEQYTQTSAALTDISLLNLLSTVIAAPLVEEIIFRGLIQPHLARVLPGWRALLLSALLFGLCHGSLLWIIYATLLGIAFGWLRWRTGSILPSLAAHVVFNLIGVLVTVSQAAGFAHRLPFALALFCLGGCLLTRRGLAQLFLLHPEQPEIPPDAT